MVFLATGAAPPGLFHPDVFLDFTVPQWRVQAQGPGDVLDGSISAISVYCTGDWDEAFQARHAREVALLRP